MACLDTFSFELPARIRPRDIVKAYHQRCMHCQRRPKLLRRALNETPITKIPRKILHADYLFINHRSHFLVIVDNATGKVFLKHTSHDSAKVMSLALIEFMGNFSFYQNFKSTLTRAVTLLANF